MLRDQLILQLSSVIYVLKETTAQLVWLLPRNVIQESTNLTKELQLQLSA